MKTFTIPVTITLHGEGALDKATAAAILEAVLCGDGCEALTEAYQEDFGGHKGATILASVGGM